MSYLDQLRAQVKANLDARGAKQSELDGILEAPTAEARSLNETEAATFEAAKSELIELDEQRSALDVKVKELEDTEARKAEAQKALDALGVSTASTPVIDVRVKKEARTYRPDGETHFLADAYAARQGDMAAAQRIQRHQTEESIERRDVGTAAFSGLVVPQYLTELVAPLARARRPFLDNAVTRRALPADGMTVNISRITTGTATTIQASENTAATETNIDDTLLTVNVRTISGMQDVSKQALQRGTGVLDIVVQDLINAYNTKLDYSCLNDDGTSGTHLGVLNVGTNLVTYTDASPTAAEAYPAIWNAVSQIESNTFQGATHIIMHPRRWAWFASQTSSAFPLVQLYNTAPQMAGNSAGSGYGTVGNLAGLEVVTDANLSTTIGASTNQDVILVVNSNEMHLWEDPSAPYYVRFEQPDGNVAERIVLYGFSAFTAGRYPTSASQINGTGLTAPTF